MRWYVGKFRRDEDGALLVFFAMCAAAIFLVAALSFDIGKRASTQTELQSFADNIALAAGGELDGLPGALVRAERAANDLITDTYAFGEGDRILGAGDFDLEFYSRLPFETSDTALTSALSPGPISDQTARFVQVILNPVNVEWDFASLLGMFSDEALPDTEVSAEATAGYTTAACNVTPVFFCMPEPGDGDDAIWDPQNHIGSSVRLRSGDGPGSTWDAGEFGYMDADRLGTLPADPCHGASDSALISCLLGAETILSRCFENGKLALLRGRSGVFPAFLNTQMDIYNTTSGLQNNSNFRPGPIVTKPYETGSMCSGQSTVSTNQTTHFPIDDCLRDGGCTSRFGDGDWSLGRLEYVETNYSLDYDTFGSITPEEQIQIGGETYHIDDPFRPSGGTPRIPDYSSFPVVAIPSSRWNYYNAEVAAAYYQNPAGAYIDGEVDTFALRRATPQDLIPDLIQVTEVENDDDGDGDGDDGGDGDDDAPDTVTTLYPRNGTSLPHCAPSGNHNLDPRRRTIVAAVVDCSVQPIDGNANARATWFVELFLPQVTQPQSGGYMQIEGEIVSGGLQNDPAPTSGIFRNLVQLYR